MTMSPFAHEPVRLAVARERVTLPYRPAAAWVSAAGSSAGPSGALLPLLDDLDRGRIIALLARGHVTADDMSDAFCEALKTAVPSSPGFQWWESYRLLMLSTDYKVVGRLTVAGMDPWTLTVAQWVSGLYALLTCDTDPKDRFKFDAALSDPPAGVEEDDGWGDMTFDEMVSSARGTPGMR